MAVTAAPLGDAAVRCVVSDLAEAHALYAAIVAAGLDGVTNVVPTWRCVVVTLAEPMYLDPVLDFVSSIDAAALPTPLPREHELAVRYDGPDLDEVARRCAMTTNEVAAVHSAADYVVAFLGFAPGFAYLTEVPTVLQVPRRPTPRRQVPAGAVGIADNVTGVYPAELPGGWQIIGTIDEPLFDEQRTPPALLAPGDVVRFVRA